jgi:hypothetical protein
VTRFRVPPDNVRQTFRRFSIVPDFALSHRQEYEADRTATELTDAQVNAGGLIRDALQGRWVAQHFWPTVY